ncbi:MAG: diphthamide biosynthesis enzyme Dph2 [Methanospirillum sp.]|uniref:diphthamide biosynthesis enzyme Dph2 n=1 Tax=Methanospirillum sp. TaxID=45200 RepID=UPI002370BAB4|nr:diphthamide biosynthesis enzyme Dph2 [Methanospirillum sp.]MDD1727827.1 diphthamide biosynthesis enzyme Dph2 [Methanospirillum sp.]
MTENFELIAELHKGGAHRVALQAPEGLKRRLFRLAGELKSAGFKVSISGDPCYGACDLDLEMLRDADILIHLGHAPVDGTDQVLYDIYRMDFDPVVVLNAVPYLTGPEIGLVTTVQHVHLIPAVSNILEDAGFAVTVAEGSGRTPYAGQILGCSFDAARKTGASEILYLGTGLFHPLGVQIATGSRVIACDPFTRNVEVVDGERLLRRRYALIEKARTADQIGILFSPKSGQGRRELAERLASLSPKATTILLREVTPDQLLNLGFSCYVNTACPRLAYDDQVRWPVPVLTPQEFEILCGVRTFDNYEVDEIR